MRLSMHHQAFLFAVMRGKLSRKKHRAGQKIVSQKHLKFVDSKPVYAILSLLPQGAAQLNPKIQKQDGTHHRKKQGQLRSTRRR
jgi:hypothetical protein